MCAHFVSLARGERSIYTSPIKALANEKFFHLSRAFGPENVGLLTGDAAVNPRAPVLCATAEILANVALREGARADVARVVMDEFHYYADKDRGAAWQIPLLELSNATFLLMSATIGDTTPFEGYLARLTNKPVRVVRSTDRPVPLHFSYGEIPLHEAVLELTREGKAPVYIVSFTQRGAAEEAQNLMSIDVCSKEEKKAIAEHLAGARFDSPYGREISRFLRHGIGVHHAVLLPKYRLLVEGLAQRGLLKVISGTDTLGVGVNIPIRTVLITKLCKYDGEKTSLLAVRDFLQVSGRAGRKGFDDRGFVVVQAPEHVIENLRLESKASGDAKKLKKLVRRKPPDRGYVAWDKATFERLVSGKPETLVSRFAVSHAMIVQMLGREGGGCMAIARLVKKSHERDARKRAIGRTAIQMFRSLVDAGIVEVAREDGRRTVRVSADLQEDFSLNHALALYLVETLPLLDREQPTYALDVLTLAESILEEPEVILMRQLDKLKQRRLAELKAAGVEYDERIAELDKMEYPKPNREFVYDTFNAFARQHPWVGAENIRPKSVARDMNEQFMSFAEYVKEYELHRSEGLLLRYLSDVYKVLLQTVPPVFRTPEVQDLITYFGAMVRQIDSSLLDEWERMRDPARAPEPPAEGQALAEPEGSRDITRDARGFEVLVHNAVFDLVRSIARRDHEGAKERAGSADWSARAIEAAIAPFLAEHGAIRTDAEARSKKHFVVAPGEWSWTFRQVLLAEDPTEWCVSGKVDVEGSRIEGRVVLKLEGIGPV